MLIRVYPANGKQEKYTSAELGLADIEEFRNFDYD